MDAVVLSLRASERSSNLNFLCVAHCFVYQMNLIVKDGIYILNRNQPGLFKG